jgi:hypothetical protein
MQQYTVQEFGAGVESKRALFGGDKGMHQIRREEGGREACSNSVALLEESGYVSNDVGCDLNGPF